MNTCPSVSGIEALIQFFKYDFLASSNSEVSQKPQFLMYPNRASDKVHVSWNNIGNNNHLEIIISQIMRHEW